MEVGSEFVDHGADPSPCPGPEVSGQSGTRPPRPVARAEKRERSRRRVEKVALAMFARSGFDAVAVEEICAEAAISPATFYRYFGTKEGVIFRYEEEFLAAASRLGRSVDAAVQPVDQVRNILCRCSEFFDGQRDVRVLRDRIVLTNPTLLRHTYFAERRFETALAEALAAARGEGEPSTGTLLDAAMCMVVLRLALVEWRHLGDVPLWPLTQEIHESLRVRLS